MAAKKYFKIFTAFFVLAICSAFAFAEPVILDYGELLTEEEEEMLFEVMEEISEYGNVAFVSNGENSGYDGYASELAQKYCNELFEDGSGTVFLIDMYNRRIEIFSIGEMYKMINKARANGITDNVYTYASDGCYFDCAFEAFYQILTIAEGGKVAVPMRYATNFLLATGLVLLAMYVLTMRGRAAYSFDEDEKVVIESPKDDSYFHLEKTVLTKETRTVHSSSSSGGGGGGGGGRSGGGGGGGHSF